MVYNQGTTLWLDNSGILTAVLPKLEACILLTVLKVLLKPTLSSDAIMEQDKYGYFKEKKGLDRVK